MSAGNKAAPSRTVLLPVPPAGEFTVGELPALAATVLAAAEVLDGQVCLRPLEPVWHDEAVSVLQAALKEATPRGLAVVRHAAIDLGTSMPVADIAVVPRELVTAGGVVFPPAAVLLVIEVTAPGTVTRDRVLRPAQYAAGSIGCFWRADNQDGTIVIRAFELGPDGSYTPSGSYRDRIDVEYPWVIDIEIPEVTW